jgi:hypothetical protein
VGQISLALFGAWAIPIAGVVCESAMSSNPVTTPDFHRERLASKPGTILVRSSCPLCATTFTLQLQDMKEAEDEHWRECSKVRRAK